MTAIACGKCRRPNPPARKFCGECGNALWEKCSQCAAELPPQERYCGQCGCDVRALFEQKAAELEAALRDAEAALDEHRYDDARLQLRSLQALGDPRFAAIAQCADSLLAGLESNKAEALARAAESLEAAKQLRAMHDYDRAAAALAQIPVALRSDEMQGLLTSAQAQRDETLSLAGEIRAAVAGRQYSGLLPKLDRLLALKPDHATARKLAEQLREQLVAKARRALADHQYEAAVAVLDAIPASLETTETQQLADGARELACLAAAVRTAPVADAAAVAIAQRFVKVAGNKAEAAQLASKLQARAAQQPAHRRLAAPDWAPAPRRTALGMPVDWLGQMPAFPAEPLASEALAKHPGRFAVALGLALEGLAASAVAINHLPPAERAGFLSALATPLGGKRASGAAWGLDLSPSGLKAVQLARDARTGMFHVAAAEFIPHAKTLTNPETELEQRDLIGKTLRAFLEKHAPDRNDTIVGGIAGHQVLGRFFELPPMHAKKVASAVEYEARHQLPVPLEELAWGYAILDPASGKEADTKPRRIVLSAARQFHAAERAALFQAFGIKLDMLQSDCLALHNAALHEFFPAPATNNGEAICLLDVGVEGTNLVISSPHGVWFRSIRQGTHDLASAMVKDLQLTYTQAELLQREPYRARRLHQLVELSQPWIAQLASEVGKSLEAYGKLFPQTPLCRLFGLGGGFCTFGLLKQLRLGPT
jgi:Tfp pilus assembly PilM family ATPase